MNVTDRLVVSAAMLAVTLTTIPAHAITAGDVLDRMEPQSQSGFIQGAVDMASHLHAVNGDREKANCAVEWLFENEGGIDEVFIFFEAHKDKDAMGLLDVLINRKCGQ